MSEADDIALAALDAAIAELTRQRERIIAARRDGAPELAELRAKCILLGVALDADGTVGEYGAAQLTGLAAATLKNRRTKGDPPRHHKVGRNVRYRLADLAEFLTSLEGH